MIVQIILMSLVPVLIGVELLRLAAVAAIRRWKD